MKFNYYRTPAYSVWGIAFTRTPRSFGYCFDFGTVSIAGAFPMPRNPRYRVHRVLALRSKGKALGEY